MIMGIFKHIKRKSKNPTIKLCPQCHEPSLRKNFTGQWANVDYYECTNCDYKGSLYIELDLTGEAVDDAEIRALQKEFPEEMRE